MNRLLGRFAFRKFVLDHKSRDFGIGLGRKRMALGGKFLAQRPEILDDAVVDDREPWRSVRMGVGFGRPAVRRPARVADADRAAKRRRGEFRLQVPELAFGAPPLQPAVLESRHAGGIIAAVFEPLQRVDDGACDGPRPENPDNSTHPTIPCLKSLRPAEALGHGRASLQVKFGEGNVKFEAARESRRGSRYNIMDVFKVTRQAGDSAAIA